MISPDGRKLFDQDPEGMIMAVSVQEHEGGLRIGRPAPVIPSWMRSVDHRCGVLPDGTLLLLERIGGEETPPVTLTPNWPRMLKDSLEGR